MAHNLATLNGQTAMAYLDATPWHGLGQKLNLTGVTGSAVIDAALDAAQMRYTVGSVPMFLADGTQVPGHMASVRYGADGAIASVFSTVGEGYTHIQNERAVDLLRVLADGWSCVPAAAGVLDQGQRAWMLMRLPDATITPIDGDDLRGYFLLHWDHTGQVALQGLMTEIRVVCQNTLNVATSNRRAWITVKHTSSADARIDEAARLMSTLMETLSASGETFASMARKAMSADEIVQFIDAVVPNTDPRAKVISPIIMARRETVARLVHAGRGAALANQAVSTADGGASVWAVLNAVTEYVDHVRPAEAQSAAGVLKAQQSAIFGGNAGIKVAALNMARELVAV